MHFVMQVRPGRNPRIAYIPDDLTFLNMLTPCNSKRVQMSVTRVKPVLVFDQHIVSEAGNIGIHIDNLSVSRSHNRVA